MIEKIFSIIGIIGFIIICVLSFIIPNDPFEVIKGVNYDYPIWLCIILIGNIIYAIILYNIYNLINKMIIRNLNKNNIVR